MDMETGRQSRISELWRGQCHALCVGGFIPGFVSFVLRYFKVILMFILLWLSG